MSAIANAILRKHFRDYEESDFSTFLNFQTFLLRRRTRVHNWFWLRLEQQDVPVGRQAAGKGSNDEVPSGVYVFAFHRSFSPADSTLSLTVAASHAETSEPSAP